MSGFEPGMLAVCMPKKGGSAAQLQQAASNWPRWACCCRKQGAQDPLLYGQPLHLALWSGLLPQLLLWGHGLGGLHSHDPVLARWVDCTLTIMTQCFLGECAAPWQSWPSACQVSGCTLTVRTQCFLGEWAAPWQWGPNAFGVSGLHPDSEDLVLLGWVGCTLTVRTQCFWVEWAAPWQSGPSACKVMWLQPDNHDPVLSGWVGCTLMIMTQCLPGEWLYGWVGCTLTPSQSWPSACQVSASWL